MIYSIYQIYDLEATHYAMPNKYIHEILPVYIFMQ